jgi:hypothetical protein
MSSVLRMGTTRTESPTSTCGTATFGFPLIADTSASLSVMPSGAKIRVRMNASHGIPDTRSMMSPETAYRTL